jgi:hypothetical protein
MILTILGFIFWVVASVMFEFMRTSGPYISTWGTKDTMDCLTWEHIPKCLTFFSLPASIVIEYYNLLERKKRTKLIFVIMIVVIISLIYYLMLFLSLCGLCPLSSL